MPEKLTWEQINKWGDFADKNFKRGMVFTDLWDKYKKENPGTDIDPIALQESLEMVRKKAQETAGKQGDQSEFIKTGYTFPKVDYTDENTGKSLKLGRMNSDYITEFQPTDQMAQEKVPTVDRVPTSIDPSKVYWDRYRDQWSWENPQTGDIEYGVKGIEKKDPQLNKIYKETMSREKVKKMSDWIAEGVAKQ